MTRRIAAVVCCLSVVQPAALAADEIVPGRPAPLTLSRLDATAQPGPIRKASMNGDTMKKLSTGTGWPGRRLQDSYDDRSWVERHPVWTGAMVGFSAGFLITYAATHDDRDEFIQIMSPGAAGIFWGGVCAGVGALAGWAMGRSRDDAPQSGDGGGSNSGVR